MITKSSKDIQRGDIFTRLIVIETNVKPPKEKEYAKNIGKWHRCMCNCDNHTIVTVPEVSLINENTQSCGCLKKEKAKIQIEKNRKQMIKNGNTTRPTSKTFNLTFNGETKSLTEWANDIGITKQALSKRLKKLSLEEALTKGDKNDNQTTRDNFKRFNEHDKAKY